MSSLNDVDYILAADEDGNDGEEPKKSDGDEDGECENKDEEEGVGKAAGKPAPQSKKARKKKKKKKKKGGKKGENGEGRIGGNKPYSDYTDEAPDMIKFDEDAEKGRSDGLREQGSYEIGGDSDEEESSDDEESSSEEDSDYSSDEDDDSSYDSDDVDNIRHRAADLVEENSEQGRARARKKRDKKRKKKQQKKKKKKKRKARKSRDSGPSLFSLVFGRFRRGGYKKASSDERVPMTLGTGAGHANQHHEDWDARDSVASGAGGFADQDPIEEAAYDVQMLEDIRRARRAKRRRCCLFVTILSIMVGAGLAIWFEYGKLGNIKKIFGKGKGKGGKSSGSGTSGGSSGVGGGTGSKSVPPFDVNADVGGICSLDNMKTFQGYYACRGLCDSAYCCFLPPWETHSCTRTFDSQCRSYVDACAILDRVEQPKAPGAPGGSTTGGKIKEGALPAADPNLHYLCLGMNDQSPAGLAKCNDACEPGKCCFAGMSEFSKGEDCYMDNKYACAGYHPCVDAVTFQNEIGGGDDNATGAVPIIHVQNFKFNRRRLVLEQACSKRGMAVSDACEKYCVGYECCYGTEKGAETEATCHDERTCMEMGACANLLVR